MRGKPSYDGEEHEVTVDHPRGCGENYDGAKGFNSAEGSPPRMRGKRMAHTRRRNCGRITPADAGKTVGRPERGLRSRDHPRGCGENGIPRNQGHLRAGSPPRMRGKRPRRGICVKMTGITPADAGKTPSRKLDSERQEDHPRGCGENISTASHAVGFPGSPPRMRGKPDNHRCRSLVDGITPADAGKTARS